MNYKILVNKDNLYDKNNFSNIEFRKITNIIGEEYLLEKRTLKAFLSLKKDLENFKASEDGVNPKSSIG